MGYIPDDVLDRIRTRADIVEIVRSYIPTLKRNGASWKACCPFHKEKTPSFVVNPERQTYKCFGCGKGGNVFGFIMEMEKLDFPNAVEMLAAKFGIVIPETHYGRGGGRQGVRQSAGEAAANYNARERLYQLQELLAKWYADNLKYGRVSSVCEYFKTREIPQDFASKFMIGASPDTWDSAIIYAKQNGFTEQELRSSGVVSEKEDKPGHIYDRFRNRLMFPIWNEQGRVVAFSARTIEAHPDGWKYVNSPESPVFKKSRTLYALHFARTAIADRKYVVLCEGQLDTIAIHRAGCANAVAAQGTAFGAEHASILKRYTNEVRLALDNDNAGKKAVYADAAILLPMGFAVKVVSWPGGKDADELMKSQGGQVIQDAVDSAVDFYAFALKDYCSGNDVSSPAGKSKAAAFMLGYIQMLPEESSKDAYLSWLSKELQLSLSAMKTDLRRLDDKAAKRDFYRAEHEAGRETVQTPVVPEHQETEIPFSETSEGIRKAYSNILQAVLKDEGLAKRAALEFDEDLCDGGDVSHALDLCLQYVLAGQWGDAASRIITEFMQENRSVERVAGVMSVPLQIIVPYKPLEQENVNDPAKQTGQEGDVSNMRNLMGGQRMQSPEEKANDFRSRIYEECLNFLRQQYCLYSLNKLRIAIRNAPVDSAEKRDLMCDFMSITKQLNELKKRVHSN